MKNIVELSKRCSKSYKKFGKKADPKLLSAINNSIKELEENSELGKKFTQDLKGMRSIRLKSFPYRIVYEIVKENPPVKIIIHAIGHRKSVYTELARYFGVGFYADSD